MADRNGIIAQVKALLARGDSQYEEEARTSLFLAHKKMREHGLTYGDLGLPSSPSKPALSSDEIEKLQGTAILEYMQSIGSQGGKARARNLTKAELSDIAYQGVNARMRKVSAKRRSEIAKKAAQASVAARRRKAEAGG